MIYREKVMKFNTGTWLSTDVSQVLTCTAKVLFCDATGLQYQILLINMISHVVTAVDHKVSQGS